MEVITLKGRGESIIEETYLKRFVMCLLGYLYSSDYDTTSIRRRWRMVYQLRC